MISITYTRTVGEIVETITCDTTAELRETLQVLDGGSDLRYESDEHHTKEPVGAPPQFAPWQIAAMNDAIEIVRRARDGDIGVSMRVREQCVRIISLYDSKKNPW